jgi:thymidylate kinase
MFAGTDCSGKDSLMHELSKLMGYKLYMSPRSPICNMVYDRLYNRNKEEDKKNIHLISKFISLGCVFVYIKVKPEILVQRAVARNEKHISSLEDFKKHIKVYREVIKELKERFEPYCFLEIDNSGDLKKTAIKLNKMIEEL